MISPKHKPSPSPELESKRSRIEVEAEFSKRSSSSAAGAKKDKQQSLIQRKLEAAEPYGFLLTKVIINLSSTVDFTCFSTTSTPPQVQSCPESHKDSYSIFLSDLLCPSLGKLAASLQVPLSSSSSSSSSSLPQINFMVELDFLTMCYDVHGLGSLPLTLLYGVDSQELASSSLPNNIRLYSASCFMFPTSCSILMRNHLLFFSHF